MRNDDGTIHPATPQTDILEQLTPATVCMWLRREGVRALSRNDKALAWRLGKAAQAVEDLAQPPLSAEPVEACGADYIVQGGPGAVTAINSCRLPIGHEGFHGQPPIKT